MFNVPLTTCVFPASNKLPINLPENQNQPEQCLYLYPAREIQVRAKVSTWYASRSLPRRCRRHSLIILFKKVPNKHFWVQHFKMLHKWGKYPRLRRLNFRLGQAVQ